MAKVKSVVSLALALSATAALHAAETGADVDHNIACIAAKKYAAAANEKRFADIGALFADKVDYVGPDAVARTSGAEVTKVYVQMGADYRQRPAKMRIEHLAASGPSDCLMEFSLWDYDRSAWKLLAVDHFTTDAEGKITYFRPFFQQPLRMPAKGPLPPPKK